MAESDPYVEMYSISTNCDQEEFKAACKIYAKTVVNEYGLAADVSDLSWEISARAKTRAGAVKHRNGNPESISITWEFFQKKGWRAVAKTVRHELIHVHLLNTQNEDGHGEMFKQYAEKLDTRVHCERFSDPKWWVTCTNCGGEIPRYRRSKLVKNPEKYKCSECGGGFVVKEVAPR